MKHSNKKSEKFQTILLICFFIIAIGCGLVIWINTNEYKAPSNYLSNYSIDSSYSNSSSYTGSSNTRTYNIDGITVTERGYSNNGSQSIRCPKCGTQQFKRTYCIHCGYQLITYKMEYIDCPYCNTQNQATNKTCKKCGQKLK